MKPAGIPTDDEVVALLKRDAAQVGAAPSLRTKPRDANAPKPNTRFLQNLIRDTDSYNGALRAREERNARDLLRGQRGSPGLAEERSSHHHHHRHRNSQSALGSRRARSREREREHDRDKRKRAGSDDGYGEEGVSKKHRTVKSPDSRRERSYREHGKHHRTFKSPPESRRKHDRRDDDSRERRRHGSHHTRTRDLDDSRRKSTTIGNREPQRQHRDANSPHDDEDQNQSDTSDDSLGPRLPPTIIPRGRNAHKPSAMDMRFRPSYDPKTDVALDPDDDDIDNEDWDMALEAVRDRAKWRARGAERMRDAGFSAEDVQRYEDGYGRREVGGGEEGDVESVRWKKKGEAREWDRGKVVIGEGVEIKPSWVKEGEE